MYQYLNKGRPYSVLAKEFKGKARRVLPLMLIPCVPAVVACATTPLSVQSNLVDDQRSQWAVGKGAPPPLLLRPLSESAAVALNRRIPFSADRGPPAEPLALIDKGNARARALECLTSAIYYEAASESVEGQAAVAQVILNRLRHPAFPASVCSVIYQGSTRSTGCQFSYTCDGSLRRVPSRREWARARAVADAALSGAVYAPVGLATHYHTWQVVPYWAPTLAKSVQLGAHIFYRWAGGAGRPKGFTQRYSGREDNPLTLRRIALISHNIWPSAGDSTTKPRLSLAIDSDIELSGIIRILASAPDASAGAYEKAIRTHFSGDSAQAVIHLLTKPSEGKSVAPAIAPEALAADAKTLDDKLLTTAAAIKAPSFDQLVRDFGREMRLASFLRAHQRLFKSTTERAQLLAEQAALDWEIYAGMPVQGQTAVLSLAQGLDRGSCPAVVKSATGERLIRWPSNPNTWGPADIFVASGFAEDSLRAADNVPKRKARQLRASVEPIEEQIVAAVFARVTALSQGEATAQAIIRREVAKGHELVPHLVQRLRVFERNGDKFPTLNHFLPILVASLPPAKPGMKTENTPNDAPACLREPILAT